MRELILRLMRLAVNLPLLAILILGAPLWLSGFLVYQSIKERVNPLKGLSEVFPWENW